MLTRFHINNFKRIEQADLDLGDTVVFVGPNNSGKTTALQALALWDMGWRRWSEKRGKKGAPDKRPGVTLNRRDLFAIPVPSARLLWRNLRTQESFVEAGKQRTEKTYITLTAEGVHQDKPWTCALEFYYANDESFYCRLVEGKANAVPEGARLHTVVFLPPMSGLADREFKKEEGEINVLIGEGQTAQVLRNLCWQLFCREDKAPWHALVAHLRHLFLIELGEPRYIRERGELELTYTESDGQVQLDLSSAGRGCQQVLLLLSFLYANPGSVLLLDEPDAHLEILRQRDIYNLITDVAQAGGSQIIAASHSEVVLQEAAERDVVLAFVGRRPHRLDTRSRGTQLRKALESIRMADYYLAEIKGWMLYLEGATDLAILRCLAARLGHRAHAVLDGVVPVNYLGGNNPQDARDHFYGLREAKADLVGLALFDRLERDLHSGSPLQERMWTRREIENYLVTPTSLRAWVTQDLDDNDLVDRAERQTRLTVLEACIQEITEAAAKLRRPDPWGPDIKVTDDFLDPLFELYYERLGTPQQVFKRDYHGLAQVIALEEIPAEVIEVLDLIAGAAANAKPAD